MAPGSRARWVTIFPPRAWLARVVPPGWTNESVSLSAPLHSGPGRGSPGLAPPGIPPPPLLRCAAGGSCDPSSIIWSPCSRMVAGEAVVGDGSCVHAALAERREHEPWPLAQVPQSSSALAEAFRAQWGCHTPRRGCTYKEHPKCAPPERDCLARCLRTTSEEAQACAGVRSGSGE